MVISDPSTPFQNQTLFGWARQPVVRTPWTDNTWVVPPVMSPVIPRSVFNDPLVDQVILSDRNAVIEPTDGMKLASEFNTLLSSLSWQQMKVALAYLQDEALERKDDKRITTREGFWNESVLTDETKQQLKTMAQAVKDMSAENKVDFVSRLVGPESTLPDYLNKVLVMGQRPTAWDQWRLFYPYTYHYSDGVGVYSNTAFSMALLPLVLPASLMVQPPWLPSSWLSTMALSML